MKRSILSEWDNEEDEKEVVAHTQTLICYNV